MVLKFYKNNAYPDIFLHDCQFRITYENNNLILLFPDGFMKQESSTLKRVKGHIQISDISLDELVIKVYRHQAQPGKYSAMVTEMELSELSDFFDRYSLEVLDEYYCWGQVLYKCHPYPYHANQPFDQLELTITYENRALEYYLHI